MITIPFTATTISDGSLPVYTARSYHAAQAVLNNNPVFLENAKTYRFLSLHDGWAHLDGEIGFVPMHYLDFSSFHIDPLYLQTYYTNVFLPQTQSTKPTIFTYTYTPDMLIVGGGFTNTLEEAAQQDMLTRVYTKVRGLPKHYYNEQALQTIVTTYFTTARQVGIDWLMALSQAIHETDWFRSWWSLPKRYNFAGLGVTGQTSKEKPTGGSWVYHPLHKRWYRGMAFQDIPDGVRNHLALLLVYATPTFTEAQAQLVASSRFRDVYTKNPHYGKAPRWVDLNGKWAVPGTSYAQSICRIANSFVS